MWIEDGAGIWTLVICTLQQCHINFHVRRTSKAHVWLQGFISLWILCGFGFHEVQLTSWIPGCWWLSGCWSVGLPPEPIPPPFSPFFTARPKRGGKKDTLLNSGHIRLWLVLLTLASHRCHQQCLFFGGELGWWRGWSSRQDLELYRLEGIAGCNTSVTPFVGTQSPTAANASPDTGVESP